LEFVVPPTVRILILSTKILPNHLKLENQVAPDDHLLT